MQRFFKKSLKNVGLALLLTSKNFLPKSLIAKVFLKLTSIALELGEEKSSVSTVKVCDYKYGAKAALCISVDLDVPEFAAHYDWKQALDRFPKTAEEYGFPISWGICGALALQYPEVLLSKSRSPRLHDIGVHTFSHRKLSDPSCNRDEALYEIRECKLVLERLGISEKPSTFIFPWNDVAYADLVQDEGFTVYRGDKVFKLTYPKKVGKLWNIHGTYYLTENSRYEVNFIKKVIDFAIAYGCVFHVWLHPWNVHVKGDVNKFVEEIFEPILAYAKGKRESNLLWPCTLRELANYCEARESCHMDSMKCNDSKVSFSVHCVINDSRFDLPPTVTLQIEMPSKWRGAEIYVDGTKQIGSRPELLVTQYGSKPYLFLTLSFERPCHKIYLKRTLYQPSYLPQSCT